MEKKDKDEKQKEREFFFLGVVFCQRWQKNNGEHATDERRETSS